MAADFEKYLLDDASGTVVLGGVPYRYSATLDEVQKFLGQGQGTGSNDLLTLTTEWFRERPARIAACGLQVSVSDPAEAARLLLGGDIPEARIMPIARNLLDLVREVDGDRLSASGEAIHDLLRPIAGAPITS